MLATIHKNHKNVIPFIQELNLIKENDLNSN